MHLDQDRVQRLLHGELAAADETAARRHLETCVDCRTEFAAAQREETEVDALLHHLDHPVPQVQAGTIVTRARQHERSWGRWAAGILITFGVVAGAYAVPGSPLRSWIQSASHRTPATLTTQTADPGMAGIVVEPADDFLVLFTSAQPAGHAIVTLTDGAEVSVRAPSGAASFTSDQRRLVIDNGSSAADFEIEIPGTLSRVEIRVASERIFLKQGAEIKTTAAPDAHSRYQISLQTR